MAVPRVFLLLLLMTIAFSSAKELLHCSKQEEAIDAMSGSWVLLPCQFNWTAALPEVQQAVWQRNSQVVHTTEPQKQKDQDRLYVGRTTVAANWFEKREPSLNLTGVSLNDTGVYECKVVTDRPYSVGTCATVKLTVTDAADAVIEPAVLLFIGLALGPFFS